MALLGGLAAMALTGCEQAANRTDGANAPERPSASRAARAVERDVEAPEVFQVADQGLWDGRPSLGGVWVAHAEVDDPERVIIRNDATGEFVIGALFRRERENPGPRLQVSSDAAAALGMLAGQPARLNVVALRREEPAPEPTVPEATPAEAVAVAEAEPTPRAAPAPTARSEATPEAPAAVAVAEGTLPASAAPEATSATAEPARPRGLAGLFRRRAPAAAVPAEAVVAGIETTPIETQTLENVTVTAASALDRAEAAAPPAATGPRNVSAPGAPDRPYVQIGIFSVEENASRAARMLRDGGHATEIRRETSSGRDYWRVLAGPATTGAERDRLVAAVRGLGFADAYAVRR